MLKRIEVALLPAEALVMDADCYVVVDQLRATTTIATLFARGLRRLTVVDEVEAARERATSSAALLFGEIGGIAPEGFDYGNSPVEAKAAPVVGREAVLFTTNGTRALCALGERAAVIAGALANLTAVCRAAAAYARVAVVCAGTEQGARFTLEDFAAAGEFVAKLLELAPGARLGDAAALAHEQAARGDIDRLVQLAGHAKVTAELGFGADIDFSLVRDTSAAVPTVRECGPGWAVLEDATEGA